MDYLDELDDVAIQALTELGGTGYQSSASVTTRTSTATTHKAQRRRRIPVTYLLRLEEPIPSPRILADILKLPRVPKLEVGHGDDGEADFCRLSQSSIDALDAWMSVSFPGKRLTKIRLSIAHKEDSLALPTLGYDPTLPHHRPCVYSLSQWRHLCGENEFPVDYFFYGSLAEPSRLSRLFGVPEYELPRLEPTILLDGRIRTWARKYRALVDSPGDKVEGFVFPVMSAEQEDALRIYEGDNYEVVNARVVLGAKELGVRTFRFAGFEDDLDG